MTKTTIRAAASLAAIAGSLIASPAFAGGFYIQEQSAKETGRAYSGEAAAADSPATIFFNPAGMTELDGVHVEVNGSVLPLTASQQDTGSVRSVPGLTYSVPTGGSDGGNPFPQPLVVPAAYATAQVSDRLWLGLGVSSPFGLISDYDDDFFGRYDSLRSAVMSINVAPSAAFKLNDTVSIGGGVDVQYIDVELTSALPNLSPLDPDGKLDVKGDDISVGWNAGATFTFEPVRLGVHYRSQMKHNLDGDFELSGLTGLLAGSNVQTSVTSPLTLPDIATVSAQFGLDTPWRVYGSWRYYNWSTFDAIRLRPEGLPEQVSEQNYRDTWSMALGAEYDLSPAFTLRAGTMYDESPITDEFRSTRVPDGDRTWATAGATWHLSDAFEANLSYAHVFVKGEPINRTDAFYEGTPAQITTTVRSNVTGNADIFAFSLGARF